ncbi:MAG: DctP family TRAP transporter solute-binding subunit [Desulfuromusa sp.]|nr:DctP family TRAP transporter solute-binding subunit [Desulfuromusa sp.]
MKSNQFARVNLLLVVILFTAATIATAAPIVIKFPHDAAENTPKGQMANRFAELVEQRLKGKVMVEVFPDSQLGDDNKVLEAMLLGKVQIAAPSLSVLKKYTKSLQIFELPFLFKDMAAVEAFQQGPTGQKLLMATKKKGLIGLEFLHNGLKQLSATTPLRVPIDARHKKFRIISADISVAQFEAVGATPLMKRCSEVYTLLQTEAIDGQENSWSNIYSKRFYRVQPYITESNHGVLDDMVITSVEFWIGLPDGIRTEVKKALDQAVVFGNKITAEKTVSDRQKVINSKRSTIIQLSITERQQWIDAMQPVWKKFEKEIGKGFIDAAIQTN